MRQKSTLQAILPALALAIGLSVPAIAQAGEEKLVLPDLANPSVFGGHGHTMLVAGLAIAALGIVFGLVAYAQLKKLPVHRAMGEVSELIYETCKTCLLYTSDAADERSS